jgi:hypothetical protein
MRKKIDFAAKPRSTETAFDQDAWVENRFNESPLKPPVIRERIKRLTIDVPASLHHRIKSQCAAADLVIADVVRELLERRFPEPQGKGPSS